MDGSHCFIAVCVRGPCAAIAVFTDGRFRDVTQHNLGASCRDLARLVTDSADRHGATLVVLEHGSILDRRRRSLGTATQTLTVAAAKELLLAGRRTTQHDLDEFVVAAVPVLRQIVRLEPEHNRVAPFQCVGTTTMILAVALGLATLRRPAPTSHVTM